MRQIFDIFLLYEYICMNSIYSIDFTTFTDVNGQGCVFEKVLQLRGREGTQS